MSRGLATRSLHLGRTGPAWPGYRFESWAEQPPSCWPQRARRTHTPVVSSAPCPSAHQQGGLLCGERGAAQHTRCPPGTNGTTPRGPAGGKMPRVPFTLLLHTACSHCFFAQFSNTERARMQQDVCGEVHPRPSSFPS